MDIFKAKSDEPIKNGASKFSFGGQYMIGFDNSKDVDPNTNDIDLYDDKFDDINYYKNYNLSGVSPTPTRTITPTPTVSVSLTPTISITPSITSSIGLTPTPSITMSVTTTPTLTVTPTPTTSIANSTTPTPTPTVTPTTEQIDSLYPVAMAYNTNKSAVSTDNGDSWSNNSLPISSTWTSLAKGYVNAENNNFYVACSYTDIVLQSNDGINWSLINMNDFNITNYQWTDVCFADALAELGYQYFIMVGHDMSIAAQSTDGGTSWSSISIPAVTYANHVIYGNNIFVILSNTSVYLTSLDLVTWTQRSFPVSGANISKVKFINGKFIALESNNNNIYSSTDGVSWTQHSLPTFSLWSDIDYNGTYVLVSISTSYIYYSTDLNNWTGLSLPVYNIRGITSYNDILMLTTQGTVVLTSNNGTTWTQRSIALADWTIIV